MNRISRVSILCCIIAGILLTVNSLQVFTEWILNPRGRVFTGIAHYFADYFLYVSLIAQGTRGATIFTQHLFTNEPLGNTWIYWFYTVIGKIGAVGISPFVLYNVSLTVLGILLLTLWWKLVGKIFPKQPITRLVAFLFITTASNIPGLGEFWFSPTPALNRLGGVPHQILQSIFFISVSMIFVAMLPKKKPEVTHYALLGALSFIAATANPIQMLLIVSAGIILLIINYMRNHSHMSSLIHTEEHPNGRTTIRNTTLPLLVIFAGSAACGALLTNISFARDPILSAAKTWEDAQRVSVGFVQFLFAVGPIAFFIPFGVRPAIKEKSPLVLFLGVMGALSFIMFFSPFPALLHTSPVRWLSPVAYAILPIIAVYGLTEVVKFLGSRQHVVPTPVIRDVIVCIYLCMTIPSLVAQVQARIIPLATDRTIYSLNHLSTGIVTALNKLSNAPGQDAVLVDPTLPYDVLIPITGKRTFTGHPIHTLYPTVKEELRNTFFNGTMSETTAMKFFGDHRIRYVLASEFAERSLPHYLMLSEVMKQDGLILYERKY